MDATKEISDWLSDPKRDYATGAALYAKHGKNKGLAKLLTLKHAIGSYQDKLRYELGKLVEGARLKPKPVPKPKAKVLVVATKAPERMPTVEELEKLVKEPKGTFTAQEFDALPDPVKELERSWKRLYKERGHLKATLKFLPEQEDGKTAAFAILEMGKVIDQIFSDIAYYKKHGFLPDRAELEKVVPETLAEVEKTLSQVRVRISKLKKKKDEDSVKSLKEQEDLKELLLQKRTELENNA